MPDMPHKGNQDRIDAAIKHLTQGFAAFSVWSTTADGTCKCVKGPQCTSPGKHPIPKDGFLAASTDPDVVTTMLSAGSEPNYGLVAPEGSDIITMDVDGADWQGRIADLKSTYGLLPATKTTRTPSGGLHLFYRWPLGVPMPDTNTLHGFVTRFPWKGYVVGPGSRINGSVYAQAGPEEIATLPMTWVAAPPVKDALITITETTGYELPDHIPTGQRHDEITRFVASRWNRGISKAEIESSVRSILVPLMDESPSEAKLRHDIDEAWDTAGKKWVVPAGSTQQGTTSERTETESPSTHGGFMEVGLLDAPVAAPPVAMRPEAFTTSAQVAGLLDHWRPRTDASYEGLLVTTLVYVGALMGHTPSCFYGSREQHTNIFAMLTGLSGVSRKGTTLSLVRGAMAQVTDATKGIKHSPNSGEGLIAVAAKADGDPVLVEEEEFDRFLTSKGREGSTLSAILRQAFDDVVLTSATAQKVVRAENHHIAMLGNVTREEITESIDRVDLKNGFANRILWAGVFQRPGVVSVHDNDLPRDLRDDLADAIKWTNVMPKPLIGGITHQIDPAARDMLTEASLRYGSGVGMAPFLSRRLDTIAARIALIYACLDQSRIVETLHVEAALAITDYGYDTTRWVFPETTGDARADLVLRHLREAGFLNMAQIEALVGKRALDKQQVADLLGLMGYARKASRPRADGKAGRPQSGLELA